ncbi:MAG: GGDEF domain-containing protein [Deltaproteobacteria bacterium]|nr:GGDEF domain-containing protein [Deltaproteobacteria bacterium]MBW2019094.1 GGDEF domain-containing protein [Deltaproteobacteria bacterium]MBW2073515.1 GGDEF domain-containing protein [Deltaproteobacteria bacterium]
MDLEKILSRLTSEEREYVSSLIEKDALTGVYNRRKFDRDIELIVSMSDRTGKGSGLLIIDIDFFKKYNDKYGHQEGDKMLQKVTQSIRNSLRDYDMINIYRYGGEEFVVMLPDTTSRNTVNIARRVRENVKKACDVTVSIGVSHYKEIADNLSELIRRADEALYEAKHTGRDKVMVFHEAA